MPAYQEVTLDRHSMSKKPETASQWMGRMFPDSKARDAADRSVDELQTSEPMSLYLDTWIAAYIAAGGKTPWQFDP